MLCTAAFKSGLVSPFYPPHNSGANLDKATYIDMIQPPPNSSLKHRNNRLYFTYMYLFGTIRYL